MTRIPSSFSIRLLRYSTAFAIAESSSTSSTLESHNLKQWSNPSPSRLWLMKEPELPIAQVPINASMNSALLVR